jgi:hypothetical protein
MYVAYVMLTKCLWFRFLVNECITNQVNSDVDLFVINNEPRRQRRLFRVLPDQFVPPMSTTPFNPITGGALEYIQAEVFINPSGGMNAEIANLEDPTVHCFRLGHILIDDSAGTVASIRRLAIETYAKGKADCSTWSDNQKCRIRYDLVDQLQDAWDAIEAGDAAMGSLMLMKGLSSTLDVLYNSRGWWGVKEKKRLRDLASKREDGDETAKKVLYLAKRIARGDLESVERFKSLSDLVNLVLEPLGGVMTEWVTEWEPVPC